MKKFITVIHYITLAALGFFVFLVCFSEKVVLPAWWQVVGRTHVMWLHFPIVLLLLVILIDWLPDTTIRSLPIWQLLRSLVLLATLLTATTGMLLQLEHSVSGQTLFYHQWLGVALVSITALYFFSHTYLSNRLQLRRAVGGVIVLLVIITAHKGATLTHGDDFLLGPIQKIASPAVDLQQAQAWYDVIYPVLKTKCGECHMGSVQKGNLSMNDSATLWRGGKEGKTLVAGNSAASQLLQRLLLPLADKKHMPEAEKPQPTAKEIALIKAWIDASAPFSQRIVERNSNDTFRQLAMQHLELKIKQSPVVYAFSAADPDAILRLHDNYRIIKPLGKDIPALSVSFFGSNGFSSERLKELKPLEQQITALHLAKMPIQSADLEWISGLPHLQRLNLNYTPVDDAAIQRLAQLTSLQSLSLTGTRVTAKGISGLLQKSKLQQLFIWDIDLAPSDITQLRKQFPHVDLETGFRGGDSIRLPLNEPLIAAQEGIFTDQLTVPIKHVINGAELYYTLDGSIPDSSSLRYTKPLTINSSGTLRVKAYKQGWLPSQVVSRSFLQAGFRIMKTEWQLPADEKYRENAATVLQDFDVGDPTDFSTKWLGFQKNDAQVVFDLGKEIELKSIAVNSLTHTAAHIFPPVFVKVWGSIDGKNWRQLQTFTPAKASSTTTPGANLLKIAFAPVKVRLVKLQAHPLPALPAWHTSKGLPGWFFVSEVVIN